jgi:hypothetical protein
MNIMANNFLSNQTLAPSRSLSLKISGSSFFSWVLLTSAYLVIGTFLVNSVGGIDLIDYKKNSALGVGEWGAYFYKEFFSWLLIKVAFDVSEVLGLKNPVLIINLILFLIYLFFTRSMGLQARLTPLVLIGPLSILLSFNVLRQYISIVLFCIAVLSLLKNNWKTSLALSFLAFFSHQSIIFLLPVVYACRLINFYVTAIVIFSVQFFALLLNATLGLNLYSDQGYSYTGDTPLLYKVIAHFAYVFFLYAMLRVRYFFDKKSNLNNLFIEKLTNALMLFSVLIIIFPWPEWIVNRLLINIAFIYLFLLLTREKMMLNKKGLFVLFLCFANAGGVLLHSGALSMLRFSAYIPS